MRVTLDGAFSGAGGVSRHVLDLARGLGGRGVEVVVALDPGSVGASVADEVRGAGFGVVAHGDPAGAEIVHVHLADTFDWAAMLRIARYGRRGPVVVTEHLPHLNASDRALPYSGGRLAYAVKTVVKRAQLARTDATIVLSRSCLEFMRRRYHLGADAPLFLVANGIPAPAAAPRTAWGSERVVAVGALGVQKGFDVLIAAAAAPPPSWHVEIFGEGVHRAALERQAREAGAPVRLRGWAARDAIGLESAALLCVPSRWEALPYVALEAMWAATPVVASAVDGLRDLVLDGETGLLVAPDDPHALREAIDAVVGDPELARRFGLAGRRRAEEHFSYEAMVDGVLDVYRAVLDGDRAGRRTPTTSP